MRVFLQCCEKTREFFCGFENFCAHAVRKRAPAADDRAAYSGGKARLLNARVLVIDDDETVRAGMLQLLRDWGAECDAAGSIDEALALVCAGGAHAMPPAASACPDLIISDYRLRERHTGIDDDTHQK